VITETCLDFSEFDSESTDLDLMVVATDIHHVSIRKISNHVSGLIHPSIRSLRERIRNESLGCQLWSVQITTSDSGSAHMKFAYSSNRHRLVVLV
jgi:hypothetical protein